MALQQRAAVVPVAREAPAVEQPGLPHHKRAGTHADHPRALLRLPPQPGGDLGRIVLHHRGDDHVVGTGGMRAVEAGEVLRAVHLQRGKQVDAAGARRHDAHVGDVGAPEHRVRQEQIGHFGAVVGREHGDHRPAAARAARLHRINEGLLVALERGRIVARRWRQRRARGAARQNEHRHAGGNQRA